MSIDWKLLAQVAVPLLATALGALLARAAERRSKLIWYRGHIGSHKLKEPPGLMVFTHEVAIRNIGRKAAHNVRVSHDFLPDFNVYPAIPHSVEEIAGGPSKELVFPLLVPGQQINISYLYQPPITYEGCDKGVRSDDGFAKAIPVTLQRVWPRWYLRIIAALIYVGAITVIYLLVFAGRYLAR